MMYPVICRGKASKHLVLFFDPYNGVMVKPSEESSDGQGDKFYAARPCTDKDVWEAVIELGNL